MKANTTTSSQFILAIQPLGFPWETQDPFLFCAHHRDEYPKGNEDLGVDFSSIKNRQIGSDFQLRDGWRMYHGRTIPGFPYHPHRGFETITINKEGFVDHTDSLGGAGRFGAGDVQWMTAGKGIQHSEMFPLVHEDKGNPLEIFQIWLNLPAKSKFVDPHFKMLWNEEIPNLKFTDEENRVTEIQLVAGQLEGEEALNPTPDSWAADKNNHVRVLTVKMDAHTSWTLPKMPAGVSRNIYFYRGDTLTIDQQTIREYQRVSLKADADIEIKNGEKDGYLLILEGRPIGEPVVQHGPYVMNTVEEIRETMKDYQRTQFGGWPWPNIEQVHDRTKGRFALHADGREETPS